MRGRCPSRNRFRQGGHRARVVQDRRATGWVRAPTDRGQRGQREEPWRGRPVRPKAAEEPGQYRRPAAGWRRSGGHGRARRWPSSLPAEGAQLVPWHRNLSWQRLRQARALPRRRCQQRASVGREAGGPRNPAARDPLRGRRERGWPELESQGLDSQGPESPAWQLEAHRPGPVWQEHSDRARAWLGQPQSSNRDSVQAPAWWGQSPGPVQGSNPSPNQSPSPS
jgi:hypothetical protein